MSKETKKALTRLTVSLCIILTVLILGYLILHYFGLTDLIADLTIEEVQAFIASKGAVAPLAFIFISFLQVTFLPIPSTVTILAGSLLFGAFDSFFLSYIGIMLGALVGFWLGKIIGRPYIAWIAGSHETVDEWLAKLRGRENVFLFFAFLLPLFPDDLLCSVAGMLKVKLSTFVAMQLITRTTSIGTTLVLMSGELIPYEGWGLALIIGLVILAIAAFVLSMIYAEKLNELFESLIKNVTRHFKRKNKNYED